jgi:hypothetical protein
MSLVKKMSTGYVMKSNGRGRYYTSNVYHRNWPAILLTPVAIILFLLISLPAGAGTYIEQTTEIELGPEGTKTITQKFWIEGQRRRFEISPGQYPVILMDIESGMIYLLNPADSSFFEISMEESQKQAKEQIAMTAMLIPQGGDVEPTVTPKNERSKIGKWDCHLVNITMPGEPHLEADIWVSEDIKIPRELLEGLGMESIFPLPPLMAKLRSEVKKLKGYPVMMVTSMDMFGQMMKTTNTLTDYRKEEIPAERFQIPKNYMKGEMPVPPGKGGSLSP